MKIEVIKCDGCNKIISETEHVYKLNLESERFFDGVETTSNIKNLDFCKFCAMDIKRTLKKLLKR